MAGKHRTVKIIVPGVPEEMLAALVDTAKALDISVNEAAVGPLARAYGVTRLPSPARFTEADPPPILNMRVPEQLRKALRRKAASTDTTIRGLVLKALAEHYGLPVEPARRRARGATA